MITNVLRTREGAVRRESAEPDARSGRSDLAELNDPAETEHARGPHEILLHEDDERSAAGHDEGVVGVGGQDRERLVERLGLDVLERPHRASRAFEIARAIP